MKSIFLSTAATVAMSLGLGINAEVKAQDVSPFEQAKQDFQRGSMPQEQDLAIGKTMKCKHVYPQSTTKSKDSKKFHFFVNDGKSVSFPNRNGAKVSARYRYVSVVSELYGFGGTEVEAFEEASGQLVSAEGNSYAGIGEGNSGWSQPATIRVVEKDGTRSLVAQVNSHDFFGREQVGTSYYTDCKVKGNKK